MNDYSREKWLDLYNSALVELQHSLMAGRILEARNGIAKRIEALRELPGLHSSERQAIEDALNGLRLLEREDIKYAAEEQRRVAKIALEKLESLAPTIGRLQSKKESD